MVSSFVRFFYLLSCALFIETFMHFADTLYKVNYTSNVSKTQQYLVTL